MLLPNGMSRWKFQKENDEEFIRRAQENYEKAIKEHAYENIK